MTNTLEAAIAKLRSHVSLGSHGPALLVGDDFCSHEAFAAFARALAPTILVQPVLLPNSHSLPANGMSFVHGMEYLNVEQLEPALRSLNHQRDGMASLEQPPIIYIARSKLDAFTLHCADLFAWRSFLVEVELDVEADVRAKRALAARLLQTSTGPGFAAPMLSQFSPIIDGREGPPKQLAWLLEDARDRWLCSDDLASARAALAALAVERAERWLGNRRAEHTLRAVIDLEAVEPSDSVAAVLASSALAGCEDRIDSWAAAGQLSAVCVLSAGRAHAYAPLVEQLVAAHPALPIAVLADQLPESARWQAWTSQTDRQRINIAALRAAGLEQREITRLASLGLLCLPSEARTRLVDSLQDGIAQQLDDLALLEVALGRRSTPDEEDAALWAWLAPNHIEHDPGCEAERLLLATRVLLRDDWKTELVGDLRIVLPLRLALERRFHIHGDSWWAGEFAPLLARREVWLERAILTIAGHAAAASGFLSSEAQLSLQARALELRDVSRPDDIEPEQFSELRAHLLDAFGRNQLFKELARAARARPEPDSEQHTMTPLAKRRLSATVRQLRERLLEELGNATESAYRLTLDSKRAGLRADAGHRRARIEEWLEEQKRGNLGNKSRDRAHFIREVIKEAAYTLFNCVVILRIMEATGLRSPAVVTGGYQSRGYANFRELAPALVQADETEGYGFLLGLVFNELAVDLPGLFGGGGVADLIPIPPRAWRTLVEALDDPELESCWTDDMTLGWVYQYWNDPEREALDAKLAARGKLEAHEIASKTQMFTERYMVDWLLQNSLGPMWLAMCQHPEHGWVPEVVGTGTLAELERRRAEWRAAREAGTVELTELMPLRTELERHWGYYVWQPIPADAVARSPASIRDIRILDPAVGSGHFLVVAFDLLVALYREEARHRGEVGGPQWVDRAIVERILEHNLHGVDIDPRAVQIAAAALWLKARLTCPEARPKTINLVASKLELARLKDDDPAIVELCKAVEDDTGIPGELTLDIVHALRGADHLGSLLKVDDAVSRAIDTHESQLELSFDGTPVSREIVDRDAARMSVLGKLEGFLASHTAADELGLRLRGDQLARGVRFIRIVKEDRYDLVVGNPPYQGTTKMVDAEYIHKEYKRGKHDLYAAFLLRGLQLAREGGVSALLTMRNWMFSNRLEPLREWLLENWDLRALGDFAIGAFDEVPNDVLSVVVSAFRKAEPDMVGSIAQQPTPPQDRSYDRERTKRKRAATRLQLGTYYFRCEALRTIAGWPLAYWFSPQFLRDYGTHPKVGDEAPTRVGMKTSNNSRFVRHPFEVEHRKYQRHGGRPSANQITTWAPFVQGAAGKKWLEPLCSVVWWTSDGLAIRVTLDQAYSAGPQCESMYFRPAVAFSPIGSDFSARAHRFRSIFSTTGTSLFHDDVAQFTCLLNSSSCRDFIESLNPTIHFEVGDINRIPLRTIANAEEIFAKIESAFGEHESHREPSIEFRHPGPSPWDSAQAWAQRAVDRPEGAPLPPYSPDYQPEAPTDHLSYALGVALGRFHPDGAGILDPARDDLSHALDGGILFLDGTLDENDLRDSLGHPATSLLRSTWLERRDAIGGTDLRKWLRQDFFALHRTMYENRPIHWPLSSSNRTFVAWINIHRWTAQTLQLLLADHLRPLERRIDGELTDLRAARDGTDKKAAKAANKQYAQLRKAAEELSSFIAAVQQCSDHGPPPTDQKCPAREVDAPYIPDLDDGVMINSAALWPLLLPQWKDPKKWWKELATAEGKRDYDWAHLAMRYWPERVDKKCQKDPSLAVAHGCFWRYHPARAWEWELRLQHEIGPEFRIEEPPYQPGGRRLDPPDPGHVEHRAAWIRENPKLALEAVERTAIRRLGRGDARTAIPELRILEAGLWSAIPEEIWAMELRMIERQGSEFRLLAPDEPQTRAAFEAAHPELVSKRFNALAQLFPLARHALDEELDEANDDVDEDEDDEGDS